MVEKCCTSKKNGFDLVNLVYKQLQSMSLILVQIRLVLNSVLQFTERLRNPNEFFVYDPTWKFLVMFSMWGLHSTVPSSTTTVLVLRQTNWPFDDTSWGQSPRNNRDGVKDQSFDLQSTVREGKRSLDLRPERTHVDYRLRL